MSEFTREEHFIFQQILPMLETYRNDTGGEPLMDLIGIAARQLILRGLANPDSIAEHAYLSALSQEAYIATVQ